MFRKHWSIGMGMIQDSKLKSCTAKRLTLNICNFFEFDVFVLRNSIVSLLTTTNVTLGLIFEF